MKINFLSIPNQVVEHFKGLNLPTLNPQQKSVLGIALAVFTSLTALYLIKRCFTAKKINYSQQQQKPLVQSDNSLANQSQNQASSIPFIKGPNGSLLNWERQEVENVFLSFDDITLFPSEDEHKRAQKVLADFKKLTETTVAFESRISVIFYKAEGFSSGEKEIQECYQKGCHFFTYRFNSNFSSRICRELGLTKDFVNAFNTGDASKKKELLSKVVAEMEEAISYVQKTDKAI